VLFGALRLVEPAINFMQELKPSSIIKTDLGLSLNLNVALVSVLNPRKKEPMSTNPTSLRFWWRRSLTISNYLLVVRLMYQAKKVIPLKWGGVSGLFPGELSKMSSILLIKSRRKLIKNHSLYSLEPLPTQLQSSWSFHGKHLDEFTLLIRRTPTFFGIYRSDHNQLWRS